MKPVIMNHYFGLRDEAWQTSLFINNQLLTMSKKALMETIETFDLKPIQTYLDMRTVERGNNRTIRGFIRYLDTWLVMTSAGSRKKLQQIGMDLTGTQITAKSMRLMRIKIISCYLTNRDM